jgi:hypothetical protein
MSLTQNDLKRIREVIEEVVSPIVRDEVALVVRPIVQEEAEKSTAVLSGKLDALENDIKELYFMVDRLEKGFVTDPSFKKLPEEEQILRVNAWLIEFAKRKGVALPR